MSFSVRSGLICLVLMAIGCTPLRPDSPNVQNKLKVVSAGFTGCMPNDNAISNVAPRPVGDFIWNATCKSKVYLCSTVDESSGQTHYNCAPATQ